jgi:ABC-type Fe3+-hydroxamate transport system substrate-binding protein
VNTLRGCLAALIFFATAPARAATLTDDVGRRVTFPVPARRIVSLAPSVTECLFAVGAGKTVVGVSSVDDWPAAARLPRTGSFYQPSVERIRALRPDVVLLESGTIDRASADAFAARVKRPVFVQKSVRYADVPRHLLQLGMMTGNERGAKRVADAMNARAAEAARRVAGKPRQSVFVEISASPLYAAGPGSFLDDLLRRAGGVNVVRGTSPFPAYSKEALLAADPAHYVVAQSGPLARAGATLPPPLDRLRASKTGRVHRIPADLLLRPGPRLAEGLARLARVLHP